MNTKWKYESNKFTTTLRSRPQRLRDLRPLGRWDCGFEFHRGHGCWCVVSVVRCQVEVSATDWSLVQRSPTYCCASLCVNKKPLMKRLKPDTGLWKINQ